MIDFLFIFVILSLVTLVFHLVLVQTRPARTRFVPPTPGKSDRALIVTAHPDDECMFFSPTVTQLQRQGYQVYLLCLSRGNYYGGGNIREREIQDSCRVLGISEGHCTILDHCDLQDNPKVWWDEALISKIILQYIHRTKPCMLISFDEHGVSRHMNHRAISVTIRELVQWGKFSHDMYVYELESVNILRKYISFADLFISYTHAPVVLVSSFWDIFRGQCAMVAHRSQLVWFRILYILFSRYMIVNTLWPVVLDPAFDLKYRQLCEEQRRSMNDDSST